MKYWKTSLLFQIWFYAKTPTNSRCSEKDLKYVVNVYDSRNSRVFNHLTNATQSGWMMHHWCTWNLALRDRSTKEMSGRSLRGRSAQAQVQVRGYKEEKLGLAVRTLCFICPSYRSHNRSRHPHFLSRRNFSRCVCNCNVIGCIRVSFFPAFPAELFDKLDSPLTRQRIPRRWVVMWALVSFFCSFFLILSLAYS